MSTADDLIRCAAAADAFRQGEAMFWLRRAQDFEAAKPRTTDKHGQATREELSARWRRCHEAAEACRNRARLLSGAAP